MGKPYAFILGRHPALSVAELLRTVPHLDIEAVTGGVCLAACDPLPPGFLNRLGGTVKIAEVLATFQSLSQVNGELLRTHLPPREGRIIFGISLYGDVRPPERRALYLAGLGLKKLLSAEGRRARYVVSKERQLSSVVVTKNKLVEEGAEFVVVAGPGVVPLARTVSVQEFEAYAERDFDRPGRSPKRGMLPPKLAQIMLNIAAGDKNLPFLDPFCGSGTVLGEALLAGYTRVIGSDVSDAAVDDATAYLAWLEERHPEFRGRWSVFKSDARRLRMRLADGSIGSVATEPFLGPPQTGREPAAALARLMERELVPLYRDALAAVSALLAPGGSVAIAFPVFGRGARALTVPVGTVAGAVAVEPLLPATVATDHGLRTTANGGFIYERPDQRVGREIVLLKKR